MLPRIRKNKLLLGTEKEAESYLFLGKLAEELTDTNVWFDSEKEHVVSIVGKRGSGKSYTLGCIAEALSSNNKQIVRGDRNRALLLFDTINIFWTMQYTPADQKYKEVVKQRKLLQDWGLEGSKISIDVWVPAGFGIPEAPYNSFKLNVSDLEGADWCLLLGYDMIRDRGGQLITEALDKVNDSGWIWVDFDERGNIISKQDIKPKLKFTIKDLIDCIQHDFEITSKTLGYAVQTRRAVVNSLRVFSRYTLFSTDGTQLQEMLKPGCLTTLMLGSVPGDVRAAIVSVIIKKILQIRAETSFFEKQQLIKGPEKQILEAIKKGIPKLYLFIDEAQNLLPSVMRTMFNEVIVRLVREGRNYGVSVLITTQQPTAIDARVMAQVDTLIAHKLSAQSDVEYVLHNLKTAPPEEVTYKGRELALEGLLRELPVGYAFVSNTDTERAFVLAVRPRITVHGGFEV